MLTNMVSVCTECFICETLRAVTWLMFYKGLRLYLTEFLDLDGFGCSIQRYDILYRLSGNYKIHYWWFYSVILAMISTNIPPCDASLSTHSVHTFSLFVSTIRIFWQHTYSCWNQALQPILFYFTLVCQSLHLRFQIVSSINQFVSHGFCFLASAFLEVCPVCPFILSL